MLSQWSAPHTPWRCLRSASPQPGRRRPGLPSQSWSPASPCSRCASSPRPARSLPAWQEQGWAACSAAAWRRAALQAASLPRRARQTSGGQVPAASRAGSERDSISAESHASKRTLPVSHCRWCFPAAGQAASHRLLQVSGSLAGRCKVSGCTNRLSREASVQCNCAGWVYSRAESLLLHSVCSAANLSRTAAARWLAASGTGLRAGSEEAFIAPQGLQSPCNWQALMSRLLKLSHEDPACRRDC